MVIIQHYADRIGRLEDDGVVQGNRLRVDGHTGEAHPVYLYLLEQPEG